jgi:hypothetical protein
MASTKKKGKTDKKRHPGRGGGFIKHTGPGIKGLTFYTSSQRRKDKKD